MNNYPFRNLVFRGGGILGIAYLGALKVLDNKDYNILSNIKRVSGASAGAITALATSISADADEIRTIANSLDFSKVPDKRVGKESKRIAKSLGIVVDDLACIKRLIKQFGWFTSDYFYGWLKSSIDAQFKKNTTVNEEIKSKNGLQTFSDFRSAGFRDIYVSVTNISKHKNEIFSYETKPDMPVADAVRMSMSIPLYFESIEYQGDRYADGGTVNNYPMEIFDSKDENSNYAENKENIDKDGVNWETLGCHLFTPPKPSQKNKKDGVVHYIEDLFLTLLQVQTIEFNKTPNLQNRSANIDDLGISPVDFDIKADNGDPFREPLPNDSYNKLYRSGYSAMVEYLKGYSVEK